MFSMLTSMLIPEDTHAHNSDFTLSGWLIAEKDTYLNLQLSCKPTCTQVVICFKKLVIDRIFYKLLVTMVFETQIQSLNNLPNFGTLQGT